MIDPAGPRLYIAQDDHSGLLVIIAAVGIAWTLSVLVVRLLSNVNLKGGFGFEELAIIASSGVGIASSAAVLVAVRYGFGKKANLVGQSGVNSASKAIFASDLLYLFAISCSKLASASFIKRLTTSVRRYRLICQVLAAIILVWIVGSLFTIALRCDLSASWLSHSTIRCSSLFPRWATIETISLLIECLIFAIATNIVYLLQMSLDAKVKVMFAFFTRIPILAPTIVRLIYLRQGLDRPDYTFGMVNAIIATQFVLHYTVMAASFGYLKPFLSAFDSNLGATVKLGTVAASQYLSGSQTKGNSYMMKTMSRTDKTNESRTPTAVADEPRRDRESSQDSDAPIIVKTRTFQVHTEPMKA